ncbi:hypothetical protein [Bradyrhizobium sp.]|uniref:hypothetical protein n=1 Tax=Bradyrhizobium sp. TaxID=376 RepID=UPI0025BF752C|nr:hypothetical protein [Bradyrhizobium sp.]
MAIPVVTPGALNDWMRYLFYNDFNGIIECVNETLRYQEHGLAKTRDFVIVKNADQAEADSKPVPLPGAATITFR